MELFTQTQQRIIHEILKGNTTLTSISNALQISKPALSKHLKHLEKNHIVNSFYSKTPQGRTIHYHLISFHFLYSFDQATSTCIYFNADSPFNQHFPFIGMIKQKELRTEIITYLTALNIDEYESILIILYGSVAKGNATRKSDIDILILKDQWTKKEIDDIYDHLASVSAICTYQVIPLIKTIKQYQYLHSSLRKEINNDGIILFSKGKSWASITSQLNRYKTIQPLDYPT